MAQDCSQQVGLFPTGSLYVTTWFWRARVFKRLSHQGQTVTQPQSRTQLLPGLLAQTWAMPHKPVSRAFARDRVPALADQDTPLSQLCWSFPPLFSRVVSN